MSESMLASQIKGMEETVCRAEHGKPEDFIRVLVLLLAQQMVLNRMLVTAIEAKSPP